MLATTALEEMTYKEIEEEYLAYSEREYAQGMLDQGEYPTYEAALRASRSEISSYYKYTMSGESHHAYHILNAQTRERAGILAFSVLIRKSSPEPFVFLDYISVFPMYRRRGHAAFAMHWLERWVMEQGLNRIDLNVMMHKKGAVKLYQGLGYVIYQERALGLSKEPGRYDMRKSFSH